MMVQVAHLLAPDHIIPMNLPHYYMLKVILLPHEVQESNPMEVQRTVLLLVKMVLMMVLVARPLVPDHITPVMSFLHVPAVVLILMAVAHLTEMMP